jgi:O-antigen/teichoic acid export membrane protein
MEVKTLTAGRTLARNTVWTLSANCVPLLVGLFAIPVVVRDLGSERYGVLALTWTIAGSFGLFDLGLGRAVTKLVADALTAQQRSRASQVVWTGFWLAAGSGCLAGAALAFVSPWLVQSALTIPVQLRHDSLHVFYLIALAMPFITSQGVFIGMLAAMQRFGTVGRFTIIQSLFWYIAPIGVLLFTNSLVWIVGILLLGRILSLLVWFSLCAADPKPIVVGFERPRLSLLKPLLSFGGWASISTMTGPILLYLDRFLIAAVISVAAVAYFTIPFQIVTKLLLISSAVSGVMFPALAGALVGETERAVRLFEAAARFVVLGLFPIILVILTFAPEGMTLWIGVSFSRHAAWVLRWLALGVFCNGLAHLGFTLVQGAHRPDLAAKLHLAEIPVYVPLLLCALRQAGIDGAAIVWTIRAIFDALGLYLIALRLVPELRGAVIRLARNAATSAVFFTFALFPMSLPQKILFLISALSVYALVTWIGLLRPVERHFVRDGVRSIWRARFGFS